jgi:hypothetical protein
VTRQLRTGGPVEEIELQLHLIGGSVLTIVVDAETLDDIIEEYERGGHATRTVKHRMWTWIFTYDVRPGL